MLCCLLLTTFHQPPGANLWRRAGSRRKQHTATRSRSAGEACCCPVCWVLCCLSHPSLGSVGQVFHGQRTPSPFECLPCCCTAVTAGVWANGTVVVSKAIQQLSGDTETLSPAAACPAGPSWPPGFNAKATACRRLLGSLRRSASSWFWRQPCWCSRQEGGWGCHGRRTPLESVWLLGC
jgi:hypothetical protein